MFYEPKRRLCDDLASVVPRAVTSKNASSSEHRGPASAPPPPIGHFLRPFPNGLTSCAPSPVPGLTSDPELQRDIKSRWPGRADPDRANGDGSSATQDDSGSAIIACERTTGPSDQEQDRSLVVSEAAAVADRGGGGGERDWEGEERDRKRRSSAAGEIALPCLTRLDLNNNILHNLDDLKARTGGDRFGTKSIRSACICR